MMHSSVTLNIQSHPAATQWLAAPEASFSCKPEHTGVRAIVVGPGRAFDKLMAEMGWARQASSPSPPLSTELLIIDCGARWPEWFGLVVGPGPYGRWRTVPFAGFVRPATLSKPPLPQELDQFYTKDEVASRLWEVLARLIDLGNVLLVEPSAGTGSFFKLMRGSGHLGFDRDLKCPRVKEADFLTIEIRSDWEIVFVGNPPFGKGARLAIRFFNHAAKMASVIAMILPRSFQKGFIENQLDCSFHLVYEELVPAKAFLHEGKVHDVPTVFQVWQRRTQPRELRPTEKTHPDFLFTSANEADFALRRNGSTAGTVVQDLTVSSENHYFIKVLRGDVMAVMKSIDFTDTAGRVTGQKSLSKPEIVALYRAACEAPGENSTPDVT